MFLITLLTTALLLAACGVGPQISDEGDSEAAPAADTSNAESSPTASPAEENSDTAGETTDGEGDGQISVYIGSDTNISDWWSNTIKPAFDAAHPGMELVVVHTGGSGGSGNGPIADRAYAALQTNDDPDVDFFETWNVLQPPGSLEAGLWQEITVENVPNSANIIEAALRSSTGYDILIAVHGPLCLQRRTPADVGQGTGQSGRRCHRSAGRIGAQHLAGIDDLGL
ncbi:MAG: hypothetical protein R2932_13065 [Caldilineaceae bacterium]